MRNSILPLCGLLVAAVVPLRANETQQLQQLSVELAQKLAQDKSGPLLLDGLKSLPPEVAKELAKQEGWLSLNGLEVLSNDAAASLGMHKGQLQLNGLTSLSPDAAQSLARHYGELSLNGLTSLIAEVGVALGKHSGGRLNLRGVKSLTPEVAQGLVQHKSYRVGLEGLESLTAEVAEVLVLAPGNIWDGQLPTLKSVSPELAQVLAKRQGQMSFPGLTSISDEAATILGGEKMGGNLPLLTSLSPEVAKVVGKARGPQVLNGLASLPDEIAVLIGGKNSSAELQLNGLTSLTPAAAKEISQRWGDLHLNGLTAISDETFKVLVENRAGGNSRPFVFLRGLTALSDEGAAILAAWPKWSGELPALPKVSANVAAALASSRYWDGKLPAVKSLSVEAAAAIARREGDLALDGLTVLADDVAAALSKHRGGTLSLGGLRSLSDKAAASLAAHEGRLSLNGLTSLSGAAAQSLAEYKGDWLSLDGLQTLDDAAAKAFSQRTAALSVAGLKTMSANAAQALAANGRVAMPTKLRVSTGRQGLATDEKFVRSFLKNHCSDCHDGGAKEGEFTLDRLANDDVAGRVAMASVLERLRAGDMPPLSEPRPDAAAVGRVIPWIEARLDSPQPKLPTYYAVKEKPIDGNRLPNAILFGGPRGPSVPPPPRLWRLSPAAYTKWTGEITTNANGLQQPFGVIQDTGIKDFAALYSPDEGATGLLLTNADLIVTSQTRVHTLVDSNDPVFAKETLWPNAERIKLASAAEQESLRSGKRVRHGHVPLAALLHPQVKATREELEKVIVGQYRLALARPPSEREMASVHALYDTIAADGDCAIAGKTVLMAPLMTPEVILRFEVGLGPEIRPGVRSLSPRETAFAISLALSTRRDPGLLTAAAEGKLTTREEVAASVRRILDDAKISKPLVLGFFREYFDYHRAPEVFKDPLPDYITRRGVYYNPRGMVADTDLLILQILGRDRDVLKELLTTPRSFVGRGNEESFGLNFPVFNRLPPNVDENRERSNPVRIGVLMQPSWHVAWSTNFHNDIVRRGRWVREHLLGGRVPDLPINAAAMVPDDPHRTLRQRQMVTRAAECWKCHVKMDELGLPFEDLDHYALARRGEPILDLDAMALAKDKNQKIYREAPLDTSGSIANSGDPTIDGPVRDAPEMLRRLAESDRVRQIFIRHVFRYFLGRNETPGDAGSLQEAEQAYLENGGSFKSLLVSLLSSEAFLYRTSPAMEKK